MSHYLRILRLKLFVIWCYLLKSRFLVFVRVFDIHVSVDYRLIAKFVCLIPDLGLRLYSNCVTELNLSMSSGRNFTDIRVQYFRRVIRGPVIYCAKVQNTSVLCVYFHLPCTCSLTVYFGTVRSHLSVALWLCVSHSKKFHGKQFLTIYARNKIFKYKSFGDLNE